jgi:hypothetical protein
VKRRTGSERVMAIEAKRPAVDLRVELEVPPDQEEALDDILIDWLLSLPPAREPSVG